ncbi:hypothetical protein KVV02_006398 [Mortierella alpina]|uniref:Uncharacterized protein n=1 Tax=Mortierella alpina TaxID=64518 RepID=A0A9P8IF89_MORAP|nr:hypothetical protein KVV02_006398 [Mortierella alpina]
MDKLHIPRPPVTASQGPPSLDSTFEAFFVNLARSLGYLVVGINEHFTSKKCPLSGVYLRHIRLANTLLQDFRGARTGPTHGLLLVMVTVEEKSGQQEEKDMEEEKEEKEEEEEMEGEEELQQLVPAGSDLPI